MQVRTEKTHLKLCAQPCIVASLPGQVSDRPGRELYHVLVMFLRKGTRAYVVPNLIFWVTALSMSEWKEH